MHSFNDHLNFSSNLYDNAFIKRKLMESKYLVEVEVNHPDITPQLSPQALEQEFTQLPGTPSEKGPPTSPATDEEYWRRLSDLEKQWFERVDQWAHQFYQQNGRWPTEYEYRQYAIPLWQQMWQGSNLPGVQPGMLNNPKWQATHPKGDPGRRWFGGNSLFFGNNGPVNPMRGFEKWWEWQPGM